MNKEEDKEPLYRKRKPDMETEQFRMWNISKDKSSEEYKEQKKMMKQQLKDGFFIKRGKTKILCTGFNKLVSKKTNEVVFAYKIKVPEDEHSMPLLLYYFSDSKDGKKVREAKEQGMLEMAKAAGIEAKDMVTLLPSVEYEAKVMEKMTKLKRKYKVL